jgi:3-phosphoshikimate 1-carboxyvinyltransferase
VHPALVAITGIHQPEGDKSITHRALFLGGINRGRTRIVSPSLAADCRSTRAFVTALGYDIRDVDGGWLIDGARADPGGRELLLDCGNSGTTARLGLGFLTGESGRFMVTGDSSLLLRPMERVATPLRNLGATIETTNGRLPAMVRADTKLRGSEEAIVDVASAQVHAALALAALRSERGISLRRTASMRDHTLRMLELFGAIAPGATEAEIDRIRPLEIDRDVEVGVPGDISSAAFFICAALLVPGSILTIESVGLNPSRIAFLRALREMGADLEWSVEEGDLQEPVGRVVARHGGELRGIDLSDSGIAAGIPVSGMIDELPLLALMGCVASGRTIIRGARELRVKESDRISATRALLGALGLESSEHEDGFEMEGPQIIQGGDVVDHHGDHRLCMMAAVAALAARNPVTIPAPETASVSYPGFWNELARIVENRE